MGAVAVDSAFALVEARPRVKTPAAARIAEEKILFFMGEESSEFNGGVQVIELALL